MKSKTNIGRDRQIGRFSKHWQRPRDSSDNGPRGQMTLTDACLFWQMRAIYHRFDGILDWKRGCFIELKNARILKTYCSIGITVEPRQLALRYLELSANSNQVQFLCDFTPLFSHSFPRLTWTTEDNSNSSLSRTKFFFPWSIFHWFLPW